MVDGPAGTLQPGSVASDAGPGDAHAGLRPRLPIGAVLLAVLQFAEGLWLLAALSGVRAATLTGLPAELLAFGVAGQYLIIASAGLRFTAAFALLTRRHAAWVLAMLITGGGLVVTLTGYVLGQPDDIALLLDVASAFYLNQPGVRAVFGVRPADAR